MLTLVVALRLLVAPASSQGHHVEAALIPEAESIEPGESFMLGLDLKMEEGWHTYWKNPGDSGMATTIKWKLPEGFKAGALQWPAPSRIAGKSQASYGYRGETLLLARLQAPADLRPASSVKIAARVEWLECRDICIPGKAELSLTLPARAAKPKLRATFEPKFADSRRRLPRPLKDFPGWSARAERSAQVVRLTMEAASVPDKLAFFPDEDALIDNAAPQGLSVAGGKATLEMARSLAPKESQPARLSGVLALGDGRALELSLPFNKEVP